MGGKARGKPNGELRRVQLDRAERAEALRLATAMAEARESYMQYLDSRLRARGLQAENASWNYDPLTGIAQRIQ